MTEIQQILEAIARLEAKLDALTGGTSGNTSSNPTPEPKWVSPAEAAIHTGLSAWQIRERIRDGRWRHGREYIDTSDGNQPRYRINVAAVSRFAATPPEKRHPR